MSEEINEVATEEVVATKAKTEYTEVTNEDGRTVKFAGKRQVDKTIFIDEATGEVRVTFDFRNGEALAVSSTQISQATLLQAVGHGLSQKVGDEYSGEKDVDDMAIAAADMIERLIAGQWSVPRAAGDSFSGASVVIRAISEATGKSVEDVKAFLNKKLEAAKAAGEKLTRNDLYSSFKNPASKTGVIIERLEREARAKSSKVNANDLLSELE